MFNHPLLLLLLPLLVALLGPDRGLSGQTSRPGLRDLLIAVSCGLLSGAACTWWFSRFHLVGALTTSDFQEYCQSVASLVVGDLDYYSRNRSLLNGLPAGWFAKDLGVVDGLALSSILHSMLLGSTIYVWGLALGGRMAGISGALLIAAVAALAILPRTLSFYPQVVAVFALCGAGVLVAWRWPGISTIFLGSCGVALCLATDLRGLAFGLSHGGLLLLISLWHWWTEGKRIRTAILLVGALVLPIYVSYRAGEFLYSDLAPGLEERMDVRKLFAERGYRDARFSPPYERPSAYVWGHSPVTEIPATLMWITEQTRMAPKDWPERQHNVREMEDHFWKWLSPMIGIFLVVIGLLRRQPRMLLCLTGTLMPYLSQLYSAIHLVDFHERFLAPGMVIIPALGGVAWAGLCQLPISAFGSRRTPEWLRPVLGLALLGVLLLGLLPSWLSPVAPWRRAIIGDRQPYDLQQAATHGGVNPEPIYPCLEVLKADQERDPEAGYRIFR